jgi:hypothetical protein
LTTGDSHGIGQNRGLENADEARSGPGDRRDLRTPLVTS